MVRKLYYYVSIYITYIYKFAKILKNTFKEHTHDIQYNINICMLHKL